MIRKTGSLVLLAASGDLAQILSTSFNLRYLQHYVTEKVKQVHVKGYEKKRTVVCLECQRLSYIYSIVKSALPDSCSEPPRCSQCIGRPANPMEMTDYFILLPFKLIHNMHCRNTALEVSVVIVLGTSLVPQY